MRQKSERCVRAPRSQRKLLLAFTNKRVSRRKPLSRRPPSGWDHRRGRAIWSLQNRWATCKSMRMASSRFTTKRLDKARANRWGTSKWMSNLNWMIAYSSWAILSTTKGAAPSQSSDSNLIGTLKPKIRAAMATLQLLPGKTPTRMQSSQKWHKFVCKTVQC